MQRFVQGAAATLGAWLLVAGSVYAQQGTGELRGYVFDAQSAVLPGVTVVARNEASGQFREIVSGPDGSFFMSALIPGSYEITARSEERRVGKEGSSRRGADHERRDSIVGRC